MWGDRGRRALWLGWLATVATITLLSIYGRTLLGLLREFIAPAWLGTLLSLSLVVTLAATVVVVLLRHRPAALYHLLWLLPIAWLAAAALTIVEERLHLLLFGLLGVLSLPLFGLLRSMFAGAAVALFDEGLQGWLPDRVGDWGDVMLNVISAAAGVALAYWLATLRLGAPDTK